jgi:2-polyprenyl-3-methyl-5-hydroxy-6-metoxy-1,4-benzoquinol methylase
MVNESHISALDEYYNRERTSIVSLIKPGPNVVLDLGCGAGAVGRKLISVGKATEVFGIELFASAAEEAARHYAKVHCGDIEEMNLPYTMRFDYVICGDILEHLKDPYTIVKRIHGWLKDDGFIICSFPNVRYWKVIFKLVFKGAWDYSDAGVLDRTHLRFFTRKSCIMMLHDGHFSISST